MFCVKCGVELADSENICPLCGTSVYHPDIIREKVEPIFPSSEETDIKFSRTGLMFIISIAFIAVIAQLVICLFSVPDANNWAGYAIGGVMLLYIIVFLPLWFKRPNPVIFVPCDYLAALLFVHYISLKTGGGWFLKFACPVIGTSALIVSTVVCLLKYVYRGRLYIFGGAIIAHGVFMVLLEMLIGLTFGGGTLRWSYFPLIGCFIIGMGLIVIAICKPLKESLKKKLFF